MGRDPRSRSLPRDRTAAKVRTLRIRFKGPLELTPGSCKPAATPRAASPCRSGRHLRYTCPVSDRPPRPRRRTPVGAKRIEAGELLFGRYRLQRRIGTGATAEVWQAHDERLDRTVAIKALHPHLLPDAPTRARFAAEARAAAGLAHPGIVPVYDVVEDQRTPAIVLRFIDGSTLAERITAGGPVPAVEAASIGADLASALAHAHKVGIVHRDVKPGNVLVDEEGRVQLVDFGIARFLEDVAARETATGQVLGTLRYMAPEQLAGAPADSRTDLYALGLVIYELLAGRPAFATPSLADLIDAQRHGPPAAPPGTPAELAALLEELLASDPDRRPAAASEVEGRLRGIAAALGDVGDVAGSRAEPPSRPPTIAPGLPAAAAGLAMVAPAAMTSRALPEDADPPPPSDPADSPTVAFAAPPTAAIALPVVAAAPDAAVLQAAAAPLNPASGPGGATVTRRTSPSKAVLVGGAVAALAAIVLAIAVVGFRGEPSAAIATSGPPGGLVATPFPTEATLAAPSTHAKPTKGHRGHGGN